MINKINRKDLYARGDFFNKSKVGNQNGRNNSKKRNDSKSEFLKILSEMLSKAEEKNNDKKLTK